MKLTILIMTVCLMQVNALTKAQITIDVKQESLRNVLKSISQQSGYDFIYSVQDFKNAKPVDLTIRTVSLEKALSAAFYGQPLAYEVADKTVMVKKIEEKSYLETVIARFRSIDVRGKVVDSLGNGLAGATVTVKNGKGSTSTAVNGDFNLHNVEEGALLVISYLGYVTQEQKVTKDFMYVELQMSASRLDEVQVIAYGTTTRRLSTGNVSTLKAEDIAKSPVSNPLLAIQGRVPGIVVEQASGMSGSGVKVRIQGQNSIGKGNDPFFVVDGVPFTSQLLPSINGTLGSSGGGFNVVGSPLDFINPGDIESIEILKDADATSIYGSRAANGAILITTKKGKIGETKVQVNIQNGWGRVSNKLELLNTQQYIQLRKEGVKFDDIDLTAAPYSEDDYKLELFPDLTIWDQNRSIDWQDELLGQTAHYNDISSSILGGSRATTFLLGLNYKRETSVFPGNMSNRKAAVHFNFNNQSRNEKLKISLTGNYLSGNNHLQRDDLTDLAITLAPNAPGLYNYDGTLNWEPYVRANGQVVSTWNNPLVHQLGKYRIKTNNLISSLGITYQLVPGLNLSSTLGYNYLQTDQVQTNPISAARPEVRYLAGILGSSSFNYGNIYSWIIEPQINYKKVISHHNLGLLVGSTVNQIIKTNRILNASGYANDNLLEDINSAGQILADANNGSLSSIYRYNALFGRFTYNFKEKYVLNATFRRDGSSRFGSKNKFHQFGSISSGWIFSNEKFLRNFDFLSFGKIRASYGTTGNDQIDDYSYINRYVTINTANTYQGITGIRPVGLPNPYLEWEETRKLLLGLDLGFLNDKILLNANYYRNRSSNQLLSYSLPYSTGFIGIAKNFPATVQNSGLELILNSINIRRPSFSWNSSINLTVPNNKIVEFPDLERSSYKNTIIIGESIGFARLYRFGGVDPETGLYQFIAKDGSLTTDPGNDNENKTVIRNRFPELYGGLVNSFHYYNFQVSFLIQFARQKGNNYLFGTDPGMPRTNQPVSILDRWQNIGDIKDIQRSDSYFVSSISPSIMYAKESDKAFADASYVRLKNVSIAWELPQVIKEKVNVTNAFIYMQGQNLLTFTNYIGLDPETLSQTSLPPLRMITAGIKATF